MFIFFTASVGAGLAEGQTLLVAALPPPAATVSRRVRGRGRGPAGGGFSPVLLIFSFILL